MSVETRPECYAKIQDPPEVVSQIERTGVRSILKRGHQLFDGKSCEDLTCNLWKICLSAGKLRMNKEYVI